jgi:hypothetical protein
MPAVKKGGIGNIKVPHELGKVPLGSLYQQMKMIGHAYVRKEQDAIYITR